MNIISKYVKSYNGHEFEVLLYTCVMLVLFCLHDNSYSNNSWLGQVMSEKQILFIKILSVIIVNVSLLKFIMAILFKMLSHESLRYIYFAIITFVGLSLCVFALISIQNIVGEILANVIDGVQTVVVVSLVLILNHQMRLLNKVNRN